jgi:hypothetical protein
MLVTARAVSVVNSSTNEVSVHVGVIFEDGVEVILDRDWGILIAADAPLKVGAGIPSFPAARRTLLFMGSSNVSTRLNASVSHDLAFTSVGDRRRRHVFDDQSAGFCLARLGEARGASPLGK